MLISFAHIFRLMSHPMIDYALIEALGGHKAGKRVSEAVKSDALEFSTFYGSFKTTVHLIRTEGRSVPVCE